MQPEDRLPEAVRAKAIRSGNELGWRRADLPEVFAAARVQDLAIVGGQVQFVVPGGTCEMYWHSYDPSPRRAEESWIAFVERSHRDAGVAIRQLPENSALIREGIASFAFLQEGLQKGIDIEQYLCFICYFAVAGSA